MRYENYSIEDFLTDKKFIDWVKTPNKESNLFWSRWLKENDHKRQTFIDAIHIIRAIHFKEEEVAYEQILKNLDQILSHPQMQDEKKEGNKQKYLRRSIYWAAASIVLILSVIFIDTLFDPSQNNDLAQNSAQPAVITKNNPKGQKTTFILPDSTVVVLNAESTLSYPEDFLGSIREVVLTGEAYFDVHKNVQKPFVVKSGNIYTKALGTSFNIKAFKSDETISVSLSSGKVAIANTESEERHEVLLTPGEKYVYNLLNRENKKLKFDIHEDLAWKDGILYFKQSDMNEFISTIERWYDVKVKVIGAPDNDWKINGRFNNESLHNVLESLSFARHIRYTLKGKNVVLYF